MSVLSNLQRDVYQACRDASWDPHDVNTFAEEIAHLHEEVSEAFRAYRVGSLEISYRESDGKPEGVPVEFADVLIGLLYNAERMCFDLGDAFEKKLAWNRQRDYVAEGRQLHA